MAYERRRAQSPQTRRHLCWRDPEGRQSLRTPHPAADRIPTGHQLGTAWVALEHQPTAALV